MTPDLSYDYRYLVGGREKRRAKIINGMRKKKEQKGEPQQAPVSIGTPAWLVQHVTATSSTVPGNK